MRQLLIGLMAISISSCGHLQGTKTISSMVIQDDALVGTWLLDIEASLQLYKEHLQSKSVDKEKIDMALAGHRKINTRNDKGNYKTFHLFPSQTNSIVSKGLIAYKVLDREKGVLKIYQFPDLNVTYPVGGSHHWGHLGAKFLSKDRVRFYTYPVKGQPTLGNNVWVRVKNEEVNKNSEPDGSR